MERSPSPLPPGAQTQNREILDKKKREGIVVAMTPPVKRKVKFPGETDLAALGQARRVVAGRRRAVFHPRCQLRADLDPAQNVGIALSFKLQRDVDLVGRRIA